MNKTKRSYTQDFIKESVSYALSVANLKCASNELGIPEATLHGWVRKAKQAGAAIMPSGATVDIGKMSNELRDLRKKVAKLEQEKAILKKAATYFAKELG